MVINCNFYVPSSSTLFRLPSSHGFFHRALLSPSQEVAEATAEAYDWLYRNVNGTRDAWARAWATVARRFRARVLATSITTMRALPFHPCHPPHRMLARDSVRYSSHLSCYRIKTMLTHTVCTPSPSRLPQLMHPLPQLMIPLPQLLHPLAQLLRPLPSESGESATAARGGCNLLVDSYFRTNIV